MARALERGLHGRMDHPASLLEQVLYTLVAYRLLVGPPPVLRGVEEPPLPAFDVARALDLRDYRLDCTLQHEVETR